MREYTLKMQRTVFYTVSVMANNLTDAEEKAVVRLNKSIDNGDDSFYSTPGVDEEWKRLSYNEEA